MQLLNNCAICYDNSFVKDSSLYIVTLMRYSKKCPANFGGGYLDNCPNPPPSIGSIVPTHRGGYVGGYGNITPIMYTNISGCVPHPPNI